MTLFRLLPDAAPVALRFDELILHTPSIADYDAWKNLRAQSRNFLTPWEPQWADDDLEPQSFRCRIARYDKERQNDTSYAFFLFLETGKTLIGGLTLSQVRRGVAQSCTLGYWMGAPYANKGYMSKALPYLSRHAFDVLRLERIEAAAQPGNHISLKLLRKSGFVEEGFARNYLRIAGQRRDHILFGLLPDDLKKSKTG